MKEGVRGSNPRNGSRIIFEQNNMSGKKLTIILIVLVVIAAAGLIYRGWKNKPSDLSASEKTAADLTQNNASLSGEEIGKESGESEDFSNQEFQILCENGNWVKIADIQGELITVGGKLRHIYSDEEVPQNVSDFEFYIEGKENISLSGSNLSKLDNFEDRDVEAQGVKSAGGKSIAISQIRCAGAETDKASIGARAKIMNWLAENINSIAPQKAPYQKWIIDTAEFVDEKNVYVEYYDMAEDDENFDADIDTSRMALLEIGTGSDGNYSAKALAYWEAGEDDYELKTGVDKFEDAEDTYLYQYDSEEKSWIRL